MSSDLLLSERLHDVVLKVQHGGYSWRFPAHSLLLTARSPVLKELLEERQHDEHPLTVTVTGMQPRTTLALLKYIYSDECPTDATADLLVAADKYCLPALRNQLEEKILPNLDVEQACRLLEDFECQQSLHLDCAVKEACIKLLERHAYRVFASDLVLCLSRRALVSLLQSDQLNVPDEAVVFWGVWRWGRMRCAMNGRRLDDAAVAAYLDDLIVLIRLKTLRRQEHIPAVALKRFSRCLCRRTRYEAPQDSLDLSCPLRTCGGWEDVGDALRGEEGNLCLQVSFDRDVMLIGLSVEIVAAEKLESTIRVFDENHRREILRQSVSWSRCSFRKLSRAGEAERWLESNTILSRPLVLPQGVMCSIYIVCNSPCGIPRASPLPREKGVCGTRATLHGQAVVAVKEMYLVPDVNVTWGNEH